MTRLTVCTCFLSSDKRLTPETPDSAGARLDRPKCGSSWHLLTFPDRCNMGSFRSTCGDVHVQGFVNVGIGSARPRRYKSFDSCYGCPWFDWRAEIVDDCDLERLRDGGHLIVGPDTRLIYIMLEGCKIEDAEDFLLERLKMSCLESIVRQRWPELETGFDDG